MLEPNKSPPHPSISPGFCSRTGRREPSISDNKAGKRRFHFEAFWPKLDGFHKAEEAAWQSVQPGPCPFSTLNLKIRPAAKELQAWSDKKVDHVASQLAMVQEILYRLEIAQDN
jgi:hypothetical protein